MIAGSDRGRMRSSDGPPVRQPRRGEHIVWGAKARPPVFDHPSGGDGWGRTKLLAFFRPRRSLGRENPQPRLFYAALIAYIESCYLRLSFTRRGGQTHHERVNYRAL